MSQAKEISFGKITTLPVNTDTLQSSFSSDHLNAETKRDGELRKKFHLLPQPIEGWNALGYQIPNIRDTPPEPVPPNTEAAEEKKPNHSD